MSSMIRGARSGLVLLAMITLAGCSTLQQFLPERTPAYQDGQVTRPLEVPPGLSVPPADTSTQIPPAQGAATAGAPGQAGGSVGVAAAAPTATSSQQEAPAPIPAPIKGIRVVRDGRERWLVIDAAPARVWPRVREFWLKNGFLIAREDERAGILETNWAEYRPNIANGPIRTLLSKVVSGMYSAAYRSQYLVRVEPGEQAGTTEVFVSERGMREVSDGETFIWQMNPPNPDREAAMLRRLMVFLGVPKERAASLVTDAPQPAPRAALVQSADGAPALAVQGSFANAWRRTGIALDRVGFVVQQQNRARGIYYVRYDDPLKSQEERGLFSRLFGSDKPHGDHYWIRLSAQPSGKQTRVEVLRDGGKPASPKSARRILTLLEGQLR